MLSRLTDKNSARLKKAGKYLATLPILCVTLLGAFTLGQITPSSKASVYDIPYVGEALLELDLDLYSSIAPIVSSIDSGAVLPQETALAMIKATVAVGNGSGVVIHCELSEEGGYDNYVVTNHHVVVGNTFLPVKEFLYLQDGQITGHVTYQAEVLTSDPALDLALVKFKTAEPYRMVAIFIEEYRRKTLRLYEKTYVVGCGANNPPFVTNGNLAQIGFPRHMVTAPAIFGNSGGGAFCQDGKLLGIVVAIGAVKDSHSNTHLATHIVSVISGKLVRAWLTVGGYERFIE